MTTPINFDPKELEIKVKAMYRSVAENPHGDFHFEMGRALAERLGSAEPISIAFPPKHRFICRRGLLLPPRRSQGR
jgi:hypothetical protein